MAQYEVMFAGFGGQGIMTAGQLLAYTGIAEGKQVAWIPSYGPEMRGGTAYCTVVVSDTRIGSPIITNPRGLCVFNRPSFDKFEPRIRKGGIIVVNSSLIDVKSERDDLLKIYVPANDMAMKAGNARAANIAILGAFVAATGAVSEETLLETMKDKLARKKDVLAINEKVLAEGLKLGKEAAKQKVAV